MINDYFEHIFDSFIELKGDRKSGEDKSVPGGLAYINGQKIAVIGFQGIVSDGIIKYPEPEGYRKSIRLMTLAETFNKPVLTFIDIPEIDNSVPTEKQKMLEPTVHALECMLNLKVPIISVIMSMNNSPLTLDLCASDRIIMYNGASCILHIAGYDLSKNKEIIQNISLSSDELVKMNIVDRVVKYLPNELESNGKLLKDVIIDELNDLVKTNPSALVEQRFNKLQSKFLSLKGVYNQMENHL